MPQNENGTFSSPSQNGCRQGLVLPVLVRTTDVRNVTDWDVEEAVTSSKVTDFKSSRLEPAAAFDSAVCSTWKTLPGLHPFQFTHSLKMKLSLLVSTVIPVCLYSSGKTEIFSFYLIFII